MKSNFSQHFYVEGGHSPSKAVNILGNIPSSILIPVLVAQRPQSSVHKKPSRTYTKINVSSKMVCIQLLIRLKHYVPPMYVQKATIIFYVCSQISKNNCKLCTLQNNKNTTSMFNFMFPNNQKTTTMFLCMLLNDKNNYHVSVYVLIPISRSKKNQCNISYQSCTYRLMRDIPQ